MRAHRGWLGLGVLAIAGAWVWFGVQRARSTLAPFDERRFQAAEWRAAATPEQRHERARMAGDLQRRCLRAGMRDTELEALLGAPDKRLPATTYTPDVARPAHDPRHDIYQYDMGYHPWDMAGQHWLLRVYFNNQGRYAGSEIWVD